MKRVMTALLLAGSAALGACTTYDDGYGYRDGDDDVVRGAATGAAVGAVGGAVAGAVIPGVSPVEGAVAGAVGGAVVGGVVEATHNDGGGYRDDQYYEP